MLSPSDLSLERTEPAQHMQYIQLVICAM